jgi:hypothetical protein
MISGLLIEALTHKSLPGNGPGRGDRPNIVLNEVEVRAVDSAGQVLDQPIALAEARSDFQQANYQAAKAIDGDEKTAWAIGPKFGQDHWLAVRIADRNRLTDIAAVQVRLVQNYGGSRTIGRVMVSALLGNYQESLPSTAPESPEMVQARAVLKELEKRRESKEPVKTLVMQELHKPRETTMFSRGDYRIPTDSVRPQTPAVLHPYQGDSTNNRLSLARWLVSQDNPLVARVYVNRLWAELFGVGLVSTPEDFGMKGEAPSHPELLDWLAVDFMENGWSQKALIKRILTSRTYRQSSRVTDRLLQVDPSNSLLARGSRFRLPAELIRDNALSIAGLLSLKQFGPPIRPPQPEGLWKKVGGKVYEYQVSSSEDVYRRGVYVVLKRMSPYPSFINFDATPRLACRVKRGRSNTPLQSLTLLNDPVYVEAAQALAKRVLQDVPSSTLDDKLTLIFRLAVARTPSNSELAILRHLYESELLTEPASHKEVEAAWFAVALAIMNLDETLTKE